MDFFVLITDFCATHAKSSPECRQGESSRNYSCSVAHSKQIGRFLKLEHTPYITSTDNLSHQNLFSSLILSSRHSGLS
jgi:hypothetical protein